MKDATAVKKEKMNVRRPMALSYARTGHLFSTQVAMRPLLVDDAFSDGYRPEGAARPNVKRAILREKKNHKAVIVSLFFGVDFRGVCLAGFHKSRTKL